MKKYGLRNKKTGEFVGYSVESNENAEFSTSQQYWLEETKQNIWLVDYAQQAEWVRLHSTEWYNASYETPTNKLEPEDYEVVQYEIKAKKVDVEIPSDIQALEILYREKDPGHLERLKAEIAKGKKVNISWHQFYGALKNIYKDGGILSKKFTFKELFK